MVVRELELGAIRVHILHHAARAAIFGSWMVEELRRHGYTVSYGTLYPILHRLEEEEMLARAERVEGGHVRKYYTATARGREELARAERLIAELYREVVAGESRDPGDPGDPGDPDAGDGA